MLPISTLCRSLPAGVGAGDRPPVPLGPAEKQWHRQRQVSGAELVALVRVHACTCRRRLLGPVCCIGLHRGVSSVSLRSAALYPDFLAPGK